MHFIVCTKSLLSHRQERKKETSVGEGGHYWNWASGSSRKHLLGGSLRYSHILILHRSVIPHQEHIAYDTFPLAIRKAQFRLELLESFFTFTR
jgi:hypothetical protein